MARRITRGRKKTTRRRRTVRRVGTRRLAIPRNLSMGTRYKELFLEENTQNLSSANQFFIPLYNLFDIAQGQLFNQRSGTNVYFHKLMFQVSIFPDIKNTAIYEDGGVDNVKTDQLEDPRVRVLMVNQKRMASNMPIDAHTAGPQWPYYSNVATSNYPQEMALPVPATNDSGMLGKVDERNFMVRQDSIYNMLQNTQYPIVNLDQTVNVREQYSYPFDAQANNFPLNDTTLWYKVPQCWVYLPVHASTSGAKWKIKIYMKVIYDSI